MPKRLCCIKRGVFHWICGIAFLGLGGCAPLTTPQFEGKLFERGGVSMVLSPGNARETYFSDPKSLERHCRAPAPDFSVTASEGVGLTLPVPQLKGTTGINEDEQQGALSLGGRDPAVLIARELMYRACELVNNLNLPPAESINVYNRFLQAIEKIAESQASAAGTSSVAATEGDPRVTAPQSPDPNATQTPDPFATPQ